MTNQDLSILDLRDIVVPEPIGIWPPAPFVWVLLGVAGFGLVVLIWRGYASWKSRAYRRAGLRRLKHIEAQFVSPGRKNVAVHELSVLLKRVALAGFSRKQVAPLYGKTWLNFLEQTCESCSFKTSSGHLLSVAAYALPKDSQIKDDDCKKLVHIARTWIKGHRLLKTD